MEYRTKNRVLTGWLNSYKYCLIVNANQHSFLKPSTPKIAFADVQLHLAIRGSLQSKMMWGRVRASTCCLLCICHLNFLSYPQNGEIIETDGHIALRLSSSI